ncbi:MAG: Gfo/Idh/MocA family oxidoreductase [Chthoniobacterales bacterium]
MKNPSSLSGKATPPLRLGIVGASGIALRRMLPAMEGDLPIELAAVCSQSPERAQAIAKDHSTARAYTDYSKMLADDGVDAIYVASPVYCHLDHATQALRAGKHLLCEKPLGRTLKEARQIADAARQAALTAMEAYMMNFHPAHLTLKNEIAQGVYGQLVSIRARFACWYPEIPGAWRQNRSLAGGGALMDLGSHLLSLLLHLAGPLTNIHSVCSNRVFNYDVEDDAVLLCELASGARATLECSFCLPDNTPTLLEICGTEGSAFLQDTLGQEGGGTGRKLIGNTQKNYDPLQNKSETDGGKTETYPLTNLYAAQLCEFASAIRSGRQPSLNTLESGVEVLRWITESYKIKTPDITV